MKVARVALETVKGLQNAARTAVRGAALLQAMARRPGVVPRDRARAAGGGGSPTSRAASCRWCGACRISAASPILIGAVQPSVNLDRLSRVSRQGAVIDARGHGQMGLASQIVRGAGQGPGGWRTGTGPDHRQGAQVLGQCQGQRSRPPAALEALWQRQGWSSGVPLAPFMVTGEEHAASGRECLEAAGPAAQVDFTLRILVIFRLGGACPGPRYQSAELRKIFEAEPVAGPAEHVLGRRHGQLLRDGDGCLSLHHSLDHHAALAAAHPGPRGVGEGGRGRTATS